MDAAEKVSAVGCGLTTLGQLFCPTGRAQGRQTTRQEQRPVDSSQVIGVSAKDAVPKRAIGAALASVRRESPPWVAITPPINVPAAVAAMLV